MKFSLCSILLKPADSCFQICVDRKCLCVCVCRRRRLTRTHHTRRNAVSSVISPCTRVNTAAVCVYVCVYRSITSFLLCTHSLPVCRLVFPVCEHIWSSWRPACSVDAASTQGERHTLRQLPVLPARSHAPAAQHLHHR